MKFLTTKSWKMSPQPNELYKQTCYLLETPMNYKSSIL